MLGTKEPERCSLSTIVKPIGQLVAAAGLAFSGLAGSHPGQPAQAFTFYPGSNIATGSIPPLGAAGTARDSFVTTASSLGTVEIVDFESVPVSNFYGTTGSDSVSSGNVTVQVTNGQIGGATPNNGINNDSGDQAYGFNTTPGGTNLLRMSQQTGIPGPPQVSITFSFAVPVQAFGIFITDYGNTSNPGAAINAFINGSASAPFPQTIARLNPGNNFNRSVQFFGFTPSAGDPLISSVTFQASGITSVDRFGFDDVRFVQVPVPPQFVGTALMAILAAWKARRSRKSKQSSSLMD
jgi:hypothetical protein